MQPRILYLAVLLFRIEREGKNSSDKQKLKEYSNTRPILKEKKKLLNREAGNLEKREAQH